jgi:hypothetical protein
LNWFKTPKVVGRRVRLHADISRERNKRRKLGGKNVYIEETMTALSSQESMVC